jgi:hypothetical protein
MSPTREELTVTFNQLQPELTRLEAEEQPEEAFWEAFDHLVQMPSIAIGLGTASRQCGSPDATI